MLLEFKTKNYKSFLDEMTFTMTPAPKQRDLAYSVMQTKIGGKTYKALSGAVIYGPNAAGKSNIIGAMEVLRNIVIIGNILNVGNNAPNRAVCKLELIPNINLRDVRPVEFAIKFIDEGFLFEYKLSLKIGIFVEQNFPREIVNETLYVNNKLMFKRGKNVVLGDDLDKFKDYLSSEVFKNRETINALLASNLNDRELFLNNGFKNIVSSKFANQIIEWFNLKFITIYDSSGFEAFIDRNSFNFEKSKVYSQDFLDYTSRELGIGSSQLGYVLDDKDQMVLTSVIRDTETSGKIMPAKIFESMGTIKFTNFLYPLLAVLKNGGTLVIDEFDDSLHTMVVMNLINIFHNDEVNINKAQLIFTTHNPMFLNSSVYRRDEIKFVDRDEDGFSTQYSLSDIVFTEKQKVRKCADYMKNYFINKYGAIRYINMAPIFEKAILDTGFNIREKKGPGHKNDEICK